MNRLPIAVIEVGERRRTEIGDIDSLAESIQRYGLLHPIVVDAQARLVAGERRLRACEQLGWTEIDVRDLGTLTDSELREIELEENLRRKDLTEYERSRNLAELAETAAEVLKDEGQLRTESVRNPQGGRPREAGSKRQVAERIDVPVTTIERAQNHVETADAYPFMQTWKQYQVLEAKEVLEAIPETEHPALTVLLDQPAIPVKQAIAIVRNVAAKQPADRQRIYDLAQSADKRDRSLALTEAAAMPPMPDPRLTLIDDARRALNKAARMFPDDPANDAFDRAMDCLKDLYITVKDARRG
jgi:hypothetical protein